MYSLISPWPPQRNGIADYAASLAGAATSCARVFTEAARPMAQANVAFGDIACFHDHGVNDKLLYHFGNNPDHAFQAKLFLQCPGVVCLHDLSLHYLVEQIDYQIPGFFEDQVARQLGTTGARKAIQLWGEGYKTALDYQLLPMLDWLEPASKIIVHSQTAALWVRAQLPYTQVHVIPHFARLRDFSANDDAARRVQARQELDLPHGAFVITVFGFVIRSKQYENLFNAISQLPIEKRRRVIVLIAGSEDQSNFNLDEVVPDAIAANVRRTGYVSEALIDVLFRASDLVSALRYPSFGENSGSVARALGAGCALLVPDFGAYGEIPAEACIRLPYGPFPDIALRETILSLLDNPEQLLSVRIAAYAYAQNSLDLQLCAAAFEDVIYA